MYLLLWLASYELSCWFI